MNKNEIKLIFLSDMHLFSNEAFLGIHTFDSFRAVVDDIIQNQSDASFLILGGDFVQDQSENSYLFFKSQIARFDIPKLFTRGNHDISDDFFESLSESCNFHILKNDWVIYNLHTYSKGNIYGEIKDGEIDNLVQEARDKKDKFFLLFMHHNLFLTGSPWLDIHITKNRSLILKKISTLRNIRLVINGHIHQETINTYNDISFISSPSTSFQFTSNEKKFKLDSINPGYLVVTLKEKGTWHVSCQRVAGEFGTPEANPKTY